MPAQVRILLLSPALMAQWIRRPPTEWEIPGSSPGKCKTRQSRPMVRTSPLHGEDSGSIPGSAFGGCSSIGRIVALMVATDRGSNPLVSTAGWSSGMILALGKISNMRVVPGSIPGPAPQRGCSSVVRAPALMTCGKSEVRFLSSPRPNGRMAEWSSGMILA